MKGISYLGSLKFLVNRTPPHLILFVTSSCNLRCKHCFYWKNIEKFNPKDMLSLEEIKNISKNFGPIHYLTITGGEPILRKDLFEIIKIFYQNNKVKHLALHTNGYYTDKIKELVTSLVKEFPDMIITVSLSLDHIGNKHDKIRGKKNAFNNLVNTINSLSPLLENKNFDINVNSVFSSYNQDEIHNIHDFIENKVGCYHALCLVRGDSKNKTAKNIDIEKYRMISDHLERIEPKRKHNFPFSLTSKLIDQVIKDLVIRTVKEKRMILPCYAGKKSVVILENGDVYPCELLNKSFGNIKDYDYNIKKIMNTENANIIRRFIKDKRCYCTFECILPLNIIYSPTGLFYLFKKYLNYLRLKWKIYL